METLNQLLGWGTLGLQIAAVATLWIWWRGPRSAQTWLANQAAPISLALVITGTALSLIYSEWFKLAPCDLCWYQRVFLYPQVILLGMLWREANPRLWRAIIYLSLLGLGFALFNYYIQWFGNPSGLFCAPGDAGILTNCQDKLFVVLGYITIPLMSATTFLLIFALAGLNQHVKRLAGQPR